ncbi:MAG TPA: TIGR04211 family SH3 domain-containing protein [Gammaproteobacteria bacterium]|nr:TIGR04211 family SH3 domain-containing protein [Gammaproteobacteria bacterium]
MKQFKLPLLAILILFGNQAMSETRYVTDIFQITLRSGKSTQNEIIRMVPSGTLLTVLEQDAGSGYSHVRTPEGKEGWVLTRFLMDLPSARARLSGAETRLANSEQQLGEIREELQQTNKQKQALNKERTRLEALNKKTSHQLARIKQVSANVIQISSENERLKKQMVETDRENQFLQQENTNLQDRSNRDWFMVGAMVVVVSMIFGILLTRIRWKKKSGWGDI